MGGMKRKRRTSNVTPIDAKEAEIKTKSQGTNGDIHLNGHVEHENEERKRKKLKRSLRRKKKEPTRKRERVKLAEESVFEIRSHKCGFVRWKPGGVICVAVNPKRPYIVVAREGGTIELCSIGLDYAVLATASVASRITSLSFTPRGNILIISTLNGKVILYNCQQSGLDFRCAIVPGGGAIWDAQLDTYSDQERILVACEDSRIRILEPDASLSVSAEINPLPDTPFEFVTTIGSPGRSRALSVAVSKSQDGFVGVCDARGYISFVKRKSAQIVSTCAMPERCPIWSSIFVQNDTQFITGDARGIITIWDVATGTIRESLALENAEGDIRCLESTGVCENGLEYVGIGFSNGSVGFLVCSSSSNGSSGRAALWRPLRGMVLFDGDVTCCVVQRTAIKGNAPENIRFIFGSQDTRVIAFSVASIGSNRPQYRILTCSGGIGSQLPVQVVRPAGSAVASGLIVARQKDHVDIWTIDTATNIAPQLLLRLKLSGLGGDITSCALNSDGSQIAIAGASCIRILEVEYTPLHSSTQDDDGETTRDRTVTCINDYDKVKSVPQIKPLRTVLYKDINSASVGLERPKDIRYVGQDLLASITANGRALVLVKATSDEVPTILSASSFMPHADRLLLLAASNSHFAVSDGKKRLYIMSAEGKQERIISADKLTTTLVFGHDGSTLIAITADFKIHVARLTNHGNWTHQIVKESLRVRSPAKGLSFTPKFLLIHGCNYAQIIGYNRNDDGEIVLNTEKDSIRRVKGVQDVLGAGIIDGEVVIAHQLRDLVAQQLPSVVPKKQFGG